MKLTVEFPSVSYREGPQGVMKLGQAIEQIGYDHIDMFDHVVMGQAGARSVAAMIDALGALHTKIRGEVG